MFFPISGHHTQMKSANSGAQFLLPITFLSIPFCWLNSSICQENDWGVEQLGQKKRDHD
jgi:hypothetical protein